MNNHGATIITWETPPPLVSPTTLRTRQLRKLLSTFKRFRLNPGPYTPLFIMASARTGSSLLHHLLGQHPEITLLGELLNPNQGHLIARKVAGRSCGKWLRFQIKHATPRGEQLSRYRGAKLLLPQLRDTGLTPQLLHELFPDARYLFLNREDLYHRYISMVIGWTRGKWSQNAIDDWAPPKIYIQPERLLGFFTMYQQLTAEWYEALSGERMLAIDYDEYTETPDKFVRNEVFPWLGLAPEDLLVKSVKQNRWGSSMVVNEDELTEILNSPLRYVRLGQPVNASNYPTY